MSTVTVTTPRPARVGPFRAVQQTGCLAWRTLVQIKHNPFELIDLPGPQREQHEQRAQPGTADVARQPGIIADLKGPEQGDLHPFILPVKHRSQESAPAQPDP